MNRSFSNIILIGMPGSGKSTIGVILAKKTSRGFLDTDVLIQKKHGRSLQQIVDRDGHLALHKIEEDIILNLNIENYVVATGGSVVYSKAAMNRLKSHGIVVFLDVDLTTLQGRVNDFNTRGLVKRHDQTLSELFEERYPLYLKYSDVRIETSRLSYEKVCSKIIEKLKSILKRESLC